MTKLIKALQRNIKKGLAIAKILFIFLPGRILEDVLNKIVRPAQKPLKISRLKRSDRLKVKVTQEKIKALRASKEAKKKVRGKK
jgi:hypothetical protein